MIVSLHITHSSSGGVEFLNDVVPKLEKAVSDRIGFLDATDEYIIIRTCNRLEVYIVTHDNDQVKDYLDILVKNTVPYTKSNNFWYTMEDWESIKHLFRVVCGLDSMIVGEDQIQHQIRESYAKAKEEGHVGRMLSRLFDKALIVGKRVRSETELNKGAVSVGSAAVQLAEEMIGPLDGKNITILGAGDMASLIARNLIGKNPNTVFVSNRTFERAKELAYELGGKAVTMNMMTEAIAQSDLVLVATSAPHTVIRKEHAEAAMSGRTNKLLIIDVSVPRNVSEDVAEVGNVVLRTMDSLNSIALENINRRRNEIYSAERIITQEMTRIDSERKEAVANEVIRKMGIKFSCIRDRELETAKCRLGSADPEEILEDLSRAMVNKIAAEAYNRLREASREGRLDTCNAATELFGLKDVN